MIEARRYLKLFYRRHDEHRNTYAKRRRKHFDGEDPELPNWNPKLTREGFDRAHLRQSMAFAKESREIQEAHDQGLVNVQRRGYIAWNDQESRSPKVDTDHGYATTVERMLQDLAPVEAIEEWREQQPARQTDEQVDATRRWLQQQPA